VADAIVVPEFSPTVVAASTAAPDDDIEPAGRNPWLLALLVCSLAFIALGVGMLVALGMAGSMSAIGSQRVVDMTIQYMLYQAPPALLLAGFVGLAVRLACGALMRRA
jgi:hypothetical protein